MRALSREGSGWLTAIGVAAVAVLGCAERQPPAALDAGYVEAIEEWRRERIERLTAPDGWLTLVGLFWLEDGAHRLGFGPDNDVVLPASTGLGAPPAHLGTIEVSGTEAWLLPAPDTGLLLDGETARSARLGDDGDGSAEPSELQLGPITAYLIERGGRLALRVKDEQAPPRLAFDGIDAYPLDPRWRLAARFEPADEGRALPIPNVTGFDYQQESAGAVVFEHAGREHRLDVIGGDAGEPLLVVLGDRTNGTETYGGGRYVYVEVGEDGAVELDFNRLYNPPCVFTAFATCPLPPPQNRLPFPVHAGEKKVEKPT